MNELSIGIDFGTTKTLAAFYHQASGRPVPIRLGEGRDDIPTSAYITKEGEFLFGQEADDALEYGESYRHCRAFKMKLGSSSAALMVVDEESSTVERYYTAQELTSVFLRYIKTQCEEKVEEFMGRSITHVVITRPVSFSPAQCDELKTAAEEAGFTKVELVTEPEAAGYAYCFMCPSEAFEGSALVVDWGGGTLDMALVTRREGEISTHREYTDGNMQMGGEVFDERLWEHVQSRLPIQDRRDIAEERLPLQFRMRQRVRQDKEGLSGQVKRTVRLAGSRAYEPVPLERAEFEELIREDVEQAGNMARQLIAGIQGKSLAPRFLLLVGGTSKIPAISTMMERATGLPCAKWQFGREAVGLGAALMASRHSSKKEEPMSLPLELDAGEMESGCVKRIEIHGRKLGIRIPSGVPLGGKLRLAATKTQGLGDIELHIVQREVANEGGSPEGPHASSNDNLQNSWSDNNYERSTTGETYPPSPEQVKSKSQKSIPSILFASLGVCFGCFNAVIFGLALFLALYWLSEDKKTEAISEFRTTALILAWPTSL